MEPKRFTISRVCRDDPNHLIVVLDNIDLKLSEALWDEIGDEWLAVRRIPARRRPDPDAMDALRYIVEAGDYADVNALDLRYIVEAGFEIMPIDAREYVAVPSLPYVVVEYKQDWRLVAAILGLLLLVVMLAVM